MGIPCCGECKFYKRWHDRDDWLDLIIDEDSPELWDECLNGGVVCSKPIDEGCGDWQADKGCRTCGIFKRCPVDYKEWFQDRRKHKDVTLDCPKWEEAK